MERKRKKRERKRKKRERKEEEKRKKRDKVVKYCEKKIVGKNVVAVMTVEFLF